MKLVIVRHGDPDYEHDTLTETGHAKYTLDALGMEAETLPWLREFRAAILHPDTGDIRVAWDWLPAFWTQEPAYYDKDRWAETEVMQAHHVGEEAQRVYAGLDTLLAKHGYIRTTMRFCCSVISAWNASCWHI